MSDDSRWRVATRRKIFLLTSAIAAAGFLSACAMSPPEVPDRDSVRPDTVRPAVAQEEPPLDPRPAAPERITTFEEAFETALLNNPRLQAGFARFEAMVQEVPQASSLPDPMLMAEQMETFPGSGDMRENMLRVEQRFPWFGKRGLRGDIADVTSREEFEVYRTEVLALRQQIAAAWYSLAFERADKELTREDEELLQSILETTGTLYETGRTDLTALLRAQTEIARVENMFPEFDARIEALERDLVRLLGTVAVSFQPELPAPEEVLPRMPEPEALIAAALEQRPELDRYARQEERGRLAHRLAELDYYPDFTIGAGYAALGERPGFPAVPLPDDRMDAWSVSAGINLPIPNARRRAAVEQARKRTEEATLRIQSQEDAVTEEMHTAVARVTSLREQLSILENQVLPLSIEANEAAQSRYVAGQGTYLDMLDTQRTYIAVQRDLLRTHRDYLLAVADLERAAGGPIDTTLPEEATQ